MEDSTENSNKLHGQSARVPHFPFYLPIFVFHSLLQPLMAISRFLRFKLQHPHESSSATWKPYCPISSSPKVSGTGGSDPPSTATDRSVPVTTFTRSVSPPPRSRGGGGQTNLVSPPPRGRGRGGQTN